MSLIIDPFRFGSGSCVDGPGFSDSCAFVADTPVTESGIWLPPPIEVEPDVFQLAVYDGAGGVTCGPVPLVNSGGFVPWSPWLDCCSTPPRNGNEWTMSFTFQDGGFAVTAVNFTDNTNIGCFAVPLLDFASALQDDSNEEWSRVDGDPAAISPGDLVTVTFFAGTLFFAVNGTTVAEFDATYETSPTWTHLWFSLLDFGDPFPLGRISGPIVGGCQTTPPTGITP